THSKTGTPQGASAAQQGVLLGRGRQKLPAGKRDWLRHGGQIPGVVQLRAPGRRAALPRGVDARLGRGRRGAGRARPRTAAVAAEAGLLPDPQARRPGAGLGLRADDPGREGRSRGKTDRAVGGRTPIAGCRHRLPQVAQPQTAEGATATHAERAGPGLVLTAARAEEGVTTMPPEIINRGRGPEIAGTRITVYDIMDYYQLGWPPQ